MVADNTIGMCSNPDHHLIQQCCIEYGHHGCHSDSDCSKHHPTYPDYIQSDNQQPRVQEEEGLTLVAGNSKG